MKKWTAYNKILTALAYCLLRKGHERNVQGHLEVFISLL